VHPTRTLVSRRVDQKPVNHVTVRRALRRVAEKTYYPHQLDWVGGILYFTKYGIRVPGAPAVPKPGKAAVGWIGPKPFAGNGISFREIRRFLRRKHPELSQEQLMDLER
jgi:hypothetical protein